MNLENVTVSELHWAQSAEACRENDPLFVVLEKLKLRHIGSIVIINDKKVPVGIFTERDLLTKVQLNTTHFLQEPIKTYMTPTPKTVKLTDSLRKAAIIMRIGKFRHLVIVDNEGVLKGVLSVKDLLDWVLDSTNI